MGTSYIETNVRGYRMGIQFDYYKGSKGARDSFNGKAGAGAKLEPDEDPSIDIISVSLLDPEDIWEICEEVQISVEDVEEAVWKYKAE